MTISEIKNRLQQADQEHLVQFWDQLGESEQQHLADQISKIDFDQIHQLWKSKTGSSDWTEISKRALPPNAIRLDDAAQRAEATAIGEQALKDGKVGFILVAGGQGTRLGFDKPKGMYPIGPISNRTLFQMLTDQAKARSEKYGKTIPYFLMTSPATHKETVEYFESNNSLGYSPEHVQIFCQGTMPAVDSQTGKVLLESKGHLFQSPDGHGGMLAALEKTGALKVAMDHGVEHFYYGQVDNPLLEVCDPTLIGYHIMGKSELTTQVVHKSYPLEKVGNVVTLDDKMQIIEYSDLPDEVAEKTDTDGSMFLWAGNIAVHVFDLQFLNRCTQQSDSLPFHLANKKVQYIDQAGVSHQPSEPNAIKFERFIFDLLPSAKNALAVEAKKSDVFAPVKNAKGSPHDTAELSMKAISDLHTQWLTSAGVQVADGVTVEIHPDFAVSAADLKTRQLPKEITESTFLS